LNAARLVKISQECGEFVPYGVLVALGLIDIIDIYREYGLLKDFWVRIEERNIH
jgi:hypothetical protein